MSHQRSSPEDGAPGPVPDAFSAGDVPSSASLLTRINELAADAIITVDAGFERTIYRLAAAKRRSLPSRLVVLGGFRAPTSTAGLSSSRWMHSTPEKRKTRPRVN